MTSDNRLKIPVLETGIPNLDSILGGGIPELSFTILAGAPGSGKTTLAQQMLFHLGNAEHPAIYFSVLGEPTVKLLRYQQQFAFFDVSRVGRDVLYFDLSEELKTGGLKRILEIITAEVAQREPVLVVIDSFRAVEELSRGDHEDLSLRHFTHDLALLLASWNTTSFLLGEYQEESAASHPEFTVADGIIWLSQAVHLNSVWRELQVMKLRGLASLPGRHTFRITGEGIRIYPHLADVEMAHAGPLEGRAKFGIAGLDEMLRGGFPQGEACLIAGSSGTGKTLLALHFIMEGAHQNEASVMVTFEEQPLAHLRKAKSFGWDLAALEAQGLLRMIYLRPLDLSVDEVLGEIQAAVRDLNAKRVIINSVSGFELAIASSEKESFREGLYRLVASLTSRGTTILMTTEVPDLFGDVRITTYGVSFIADNILLLRYVEIESALRKAMMVIKMRTSDHDKELRQYSINKHGIQLESPFTQYSGVLSGIPTLRTMAGTQPYTPGLTEDEEALTYVLMSLREATADELANSLNLSVRQVQHTLDKLADTGYVVAAERGDKTQYRVTMMMPGQRGGPRGKGSPPKSQR